MRVGRRVEGERRLMPTTYLMNAESVKGHMYEVLVKVDKKVDDLTASRIVEVLSYELPRRFNAELLYFENRDNYIVMDISGSPFAWSTFLSWLPEILMVVGLAVVAISVFLIISSNPWLAFATFMGMIAMYIGYYLLKKREETAEVGATAKRIPVE